MLGVNLLGTKVKFGRYDRNHGVVLHGNRKGSFEAIPSNKTGINIRGQVRSINMIENTQKEKCLMVVENNDSPEI